MCTVSVISLVIMLNLHDYCWTWAEAEVDRPVAHVHPIRMKTLLIVTSFWRALTSARVWRHHWRLLSLVKTRLAYTFQTFLPVFFCAIPLQPDNMDNVIFQVSSSITDMLHDEKMTTAEQQLSMFGAISNPVGSTIWMLIGIYHYRSRIFERLDTRSAVYSCLLEISVNIRIRIRNMYKEGVNLGSWN